MTYSESAEGVIITRARAIVELQRHGVVDYDEFFTDMGYHESYSAHDVLQWLGY